MVIDYSELPKERSKELAVMVNGLPGAMASEVAKAVTRRHLKLLPYAMTGANVTEKEKQINDVHVQLITPQYASEALEKIHACYPNMVCIDYTHPSVVNANASLYASKGISYVMGTTGGDTEKMISEVKHKGGHMYAIIAPNMGKQIVAFQAAMKIMADQFPNAFAGYTLTVVESHQKTKADTSGTAKAVVASFNKLGLNFNVSQIEMVRDPKQSVDRMGVPEEAALTGHAYHTYHLTSPDGSVNFEFQHNVAGRTVYAEGTVDAIQFLHHQRSLKSKQHVFDMIDVLRGGAMK
eukprot:CAMPEP_0184706508 /NCGR_PEP_ID=MMETSP0313-20130426/36794_1 /TAXON_ID=2792 /ORGANISM="Porphyridium aerugineum, Strain SAG 1380-2" /LENGTH=293 /DNA_ID=CAMNT_0027168061 /DNA_START=366 /DNA_END=1247 /DNA_ORIENTATION=-